MEIKAKKHLSNKFLKNTNEEYLHAVEKFIDIVSNVKEEYLRTEILNQRQKCEDILFEMLQKELGNVQKGQ